MGNHEVDTRGLPYGIYDVEVEVIVNGRVISKRAQQVMSCLAGGAGVGAPLAWQVWGGRYLHMDRWSENGKKTRPAKESWLAGASTSGSLSTLSWAATGYGYDNQAVGETRLPLGGAINVNLQNMLALTHGAASAASQATREALVRCGLIRKKPALAINCDVAMPTTVQSAAHST